MLAKIKQLRLHWAAEILLVFVSLLILRAVLQRDMVNELPPLEPLTAINQHVIDLHAPSGQPRLIYLWATWCPICKLQQPSMQAISADHEVISIAMQSEQLAEYAVEHAIHYPIIDDPTGELSAQFGVQAVPTTFVLDAENKIRFVERGYTSGWGLRLRLWWARL